VPKIETPQSPGPSPGVTASGLIESGQTLITGTEENAPTSASWVTTAVLCCSALAAIHASWRRSFRPGDLVGQVAEGTTGFARDEYRRVRDRPAHHASKNAPRSPLASWGRCGR
jgi:hypothetical protein